MQKVKGGIEAIQVGEALLSDLLWDRMLSPSKDLLPKLWTGKFINSQSVVERRTSHT